MLNKEQRKEIWDTAIRISLWAGMSASHADDPPKSYQYSQWEDREKERLSDYLDWLTAK